MSQELENRMDNVPIALDAIQDLTRSSAIAVRSSWGAIASGIIEDVNRAPVDDLTPGDTLVKIRDPILADVTADPIRQIVVDRGQPFDHEGEWSGPGLSIAIGTDLFGGDYTDDIVLRQPMPYFSDDGRVQVYLPEPIGLVDELLAGEVVEPDRLLPTEAERAPWEVRG